MGQDHELDCSGLDISGLADSHWRMTGRKECGYTFMKRLLLVLKRLSEECV
jgi:hypothetical protein